MRAKRTGNWRSGVYTRQRVTTPAGTFETTKVQTALPKESPLSSKGRFFIWFTDDDKRVPVLMQTESKRGVITVLLSSQREGKDHPLTAEAF
ncbi:MAG: DUF3108 domain-containing protein [Candidatus Manganitrophus sp.]|nr:DUF3108 domain-containing protein [Candidatus Manganitrophus sp.]